MHVTGVLHPTREGGASGKRCVCRAEVDDAMLGRALLAQRRSGAGEANDLAALVRRLVQLVLDTRMGGGYPGAKVVGDPAKEAGLAPQHLVEGGRCQQTGVAGGEGEGCPLRAEVEFDGMVLSAGVLVPGPDGAPGGKLSQASVSGQHSARRRAGEDLKSGESRVIARGEDGAQLEDGGPHREEGIGHEEDVPSYLGVLVCVRDRATNTALLADGLHAVFGGKVRYTMWAIEQVCAPACLCVYSCCPCQG